MYYFDQKKLDIRSIDYIKLLNSDKKLLAQFDSSKGEYVDITRVCTKSNHQKAIYKKKEVEVIDSFINLLAKENLYLLLLNSNGKLNTTLVPDDCIALLALYNKVISTDEQFSKQIDEMSTLVTDICVKLLHINTKRSEFEYLLKNFITIDSIKRGAKFCRVAITKEGNCLDYKVSRILKFLGIELDLNLIKDFKVDYNQDTICVYNGNRKEVKSINTNDKGKQKTIN